MGRRPGRGGSFHSMNGKAGKGSREAAFRARRFGPEPLTVGCNPVPALFSLVQGSRSEVRSSRFSLHAFAFPSVPPSPTRARLPHGVFFDFLAQTGPEFRITSMRGLVALTCAPMPSRTKMPVSHPEKLP